MHSRCLYIATILLSTIYFILLGRSRSLQLDVDITIRYCGNISKSPFPDFRILNLKHKTPIKGRDCQVANMRHNYLNKMNIISHDSDLIVLWGAKWVGIGLLENNIPRSGFPSMTVSIVYPLGMLSVTLAWKLFFPWRFWDWFKGKFCLSAS